MKNEAPAMRIIIVLLTISTTALCCFSAKRPRIPVPATFANTRWTLLYGKKKDSIVNFCLSPENCFEILFTAKRFRIYDGSFIIRGTSKDSGSMYHTSFPYAGFYTMEADNKMSMHWFPNISWAMDFNKHKMGGAIGRIFSFNGMYDYNDGNLVFYTEDTVRMKKDTVIMMKFIRKEK